MATNLDFTVTVRADSASAERISLAAGSGPPVTLSANPQVLVTGQRVNGDPSTGFAFTLRLLPFIADNARAPRPPSSYDTTLVFEASPNL